MRAREISLFLLFLLLTLFYREQLGATLVTTTLGDNKVAAATIRTHWRYDEHSKYYDVVPERVRTMTAAHPLDVANAVCRSFGGSADAMQPVHSSRQRIGFNCAFHEPGLSMSADFGDLRRSTANPP